MSRVWNINSNFNRGELDPRLVGRKDLQAYYNGAQTADNVVTLVQGGMRRRNGTEFIASETDGRIFNFSFSTETNYCLLFTALKIHIFKDGVLQTNIAGSGNDYLVSPYTLAQVKQLDYIQSADTAIIMHSAVTPKVLARTSDTAWTIGSITFLNEPQFDYNDASSPPPTSEIQQLIFTNFQEGDRYKLSLEGVLTDDVVWAGDDATQILNIQTALTDLFNTGGEGSVTVTGATATFTVTFSGSSAKPWKLLSVTPILTGNVSFKAATTRTQTGIPRSEPAWSAARGFPQTGTFHEGRLWFGGTAGRPATIWGSKSNQFFDFKAGKAKADEAIEATLDTDQVNAITGIFSNRNLQVFTTGGEFSVPTSPITPENIAVIPQTNYGTKKVRPVSIDGLTLFVQRTGAAIRNFFFVDEAKSYNSSSISVLASHLINDPIEIAVSRGTTAVDANYAYIVNTDGSMTVYNSLAAEDVQGFTSWTTQGTQESVTVVDDLLYTYTKRTINSVVVYFLERESPDLTTDASAIGANTKTLTGLTHLNGSTIRVIADGAYQGEFVVSGGSVTITRTDTPVVITGGLNFTPTIKTMPLNIPLENGPNAAKPKKIVRASVEIFESNGVLVNGVRIADKTMGVDVFDDPTTNTGLEQVYIQGWAINQTLTITQDEPMPMTILAAYLEVSV